MSITLLIFNFFLLVAVRRLFGEGKWYYRVCLVVSLRVYKFLVSSGFF
jgi:hypothetical protein